MAPLHAVNGVRLAFLRDQLAKHFGRDRLPVRPFQGLTLADLGCGGGLVAEPMARQGFTVTAIDAGAANVEAARRHAEADGIDLDYRQMAPEELLTEGRRFDAVLALEIIEHVADQNGFVSTAAELVAPGGILILSTLNRSVRGYALGIVAAEHVLRWLPAGTHRWDRFVKPSELAGMVRHAGLSVSGLHGMSFDPLSWRWSFGRDLGVNYVLVAKRAA